MIYELKNFKSDSVQVISFYETDPETGAETEGTTLEEMLTISLDRLNMLNKKYPCRENSIAITKMQEALMWLNARTADRIARGVEGKHVA